MTEDSRDIIRFIAGCGGFVSLGGMAGGIAAVVGGNLSGLVLVLCPLYLIFIMGGTFTWGVRTLDESIPELIADVNETLGSTATFPDQPDDTTGAKLP